MVGAFMANIPKIAICGTFVVWTTHEAYTWCCVLCTLMCFDLLSDVLLWIFCNNYLEIPFILCLHDQQRVEMLRLGTQDKQADAVHIWIARLNNFNVLYDINDIELEAISYPVWCIHTFPTRKDNQVNVKLTKGITHHIRCMNHFSCKFLWCLLNLYVHSLALIQFHHYHFHINFTALTIRKYIRMLYVSSARGLSNKSKRPPC